MTIVMMRPELQLLISACRAAFDGAAAQIEDGYLIDWQRLFSLARRHRVEALCWEGLQQLKSMIPAHVAKKFETRAASIVQTNLLLAAESGRLQSTLRAHQVPHLFLKGLALGSLAYPRPFLKMSWDIDLLVDLHDLGRAADALRRCGYELVTPQSNGRLQGWHARRKESVWFRAKGDIVLDLHTRVADNIGMLSGIGVGSPYQMVQIGGGIALPTLGKDELFAYLCVHGASSAWFRLKWICDFAALIRSEPGAEIARLYQRSQQLGAGRAADQALLLAHRIFRVELPAGLKKSLCSNRSSRLLVSLAKAQIENETEPTDRPFGTASIHYSQLFLQPSGRFKLSELARQIRTVMDRSA